MSVSSSCFKSGLALAALGLLLSGCPQPPVGTDSGMTEVDAGCDGLIGCQCAGGTCTTGECLSGTCVDCRRGDVACSCRSNGTCNAGLRCSAARCEICPAGESGCACGTGDACGTGLICTNGMCVTDTCVAGTTGCPCRTGGSACDSPLYCDGTSLCQACSNDVEGCPCSGGVCAGTTVCDLTSQTCRAPVNCAQLLANGMCLANQECLQANGSDAVCTPMTCVAEHKWNGVACVVCASPGCTNEPSCSDFDGGPGSTCSTLHRSCVTSTAQCGPCLSGFMANGQGICVPAPSCGSATCSFTEYCSLQTGTPTCVAIPCAPGEAMTPSGCRACMPVPNCANTAGFSGRVWPVKTVDDSCVCETLDNYFLISGGLVTATLCDADGDGWVREEAGDPAQQGAALMANRRCNITSVDRARLYDEYGLSVDVLSCTEGLVKASRALSDGGVPNGGLGLAADGGLLRKADGGLSLGADGGIACSGFLPMRLLETARNDIPGSPQAPNAPAYGAGAGRLLEAAELNSLTKACTSITGDYNDNKLDDIAEVQGVVASSNVRPPPEADRVRLESFAYFLELNSAWVEGGALTIRERSRCDAEFPLHYQPDAGSPPTDQYVVANDKPYWRACQRNRDPSYFANNPQPGYDFGQYACDETSLTCPQLKPPAHPTRVGPADPTVTLFRDFGLCRMSGMLPADGLWRGMTHHSQFKCVNVVTGPGTTNTYDRLSTAFGNSNGQLTYNNCAARPCASPGDLNCSGPQGMGAQTRQPRLDCAAQAGTAPSGKVGFAAVNYRPYRFADTFYAGNAYGLIPVPPSMNTGRFYAGGCVNEDDAWWSFLCPYPEFNLSKTLADAQFGRYSCYKYGSNFMWAGPLLDGGTNANDRSTLRWGGNANMSVLGPPAPPDGGL